MQDCRHSGLAVGLFGKQRQLVEDVLDDDYGAVDDDPEVHCAERQQIRRNADEGEAEERRQQRERNDQRDDRRGAEVAEEQVQHDGDQQRALDQVGEHGLQRLADQP